jgi:hypothetical protein
MVPGVETKLSARLSTGECSNLMWGVVDIFDGLFRESRCMVQVVACSVRIGGMVRLPSIDVCSRLAHGGRTLWPSLWMSQE